MIYKPALFVYVQSVGRQTLQAFATSLQVPAFASPTTKAIYL